MRVAILADIHANFQALQAILADIETQAIDDTVSLGDNIGYGPQPEEVVVELKNKAISSVMGNHELALHDSTYYQKLNFTTQDSIDLTRDMLSDTSLTWCKELASHRILHGARFVHGAPPDSITKYITDPSAQQLDLIFQDYGEQLCFYGHTHNMEMFTLEKQNKECKRTPLIANIYPFKSQNRYLITPGSVGQPRDTVDRKAKYGIWDTENNTLEIRALDYDVKTTIKLLEESKFHISNAIRLGG